jgi:hypothetical protein
MVKHIPGLALGAVLALAVLVVGHNLTFLLTYGPQYGMALHRTGHDGRWDEAVQAVLAGTGLLASATAGRLAYLHWLFRRLGPSAAVGSVSVRGFLAMLLSLWVRLFAISILLFVLQENYERWSIGLDLPGLGVLDSSGSLGPVPVFALVSLLVAAVAALFRWGIATLEARIAAKRTCVWPRVARELGPISPGRSRPVISVLGRNLAGRAPPQLLPL